MKPREVLQSADAELESLRQQLVSRNTMAADPAGTLRSVAAKLASVRQTPSPLRKREGLDRLLLSIRNKAKRVNTLLEAAAAFHVNSMLGQPETSETYASDGTLHRQEQGSHLVFEG